MILPGLVIGEADGLVILALVGDLVEETLPFFFGVGAGAFLAFPEESNKTAAALKSFILVKRMFWKLLSSTDKNAYPKIVLRCWFTR